MPWTLAGKVPGKQDIPAGVHVFEDGKNSV
jgi:hypothetical protein